MRPKNVKIQQSPQRSRESELSRHWPLSMFSMSQCDNTPTHNTCDFLLSSIIHSEQPSVSFIDSFGPVLLLDLIWWFCCRRCEPIFGPLALQLVLQNLVLRNPTLKTQQNEAHGRVTKRGRAKPWLAASCPRMSPLLCCSAPYTELPAFPTPLKGFVTTPKILLQSSHMY